MTTPPLKASTPPRPESTVTLPQAFAPGVLGETIEKVWTEDKVGLSFVKDWRNAWRLAYQVPARCLLPLLVLQRELLRVAKHSDYKDYAQDAELNIARLEARMGLQPSPTAVLTPFEREFLDFLRGAAPPAKPRKGAGDIETRTWQGLALLTTGSLSSLLDYAERQTPQWLRSTPLGYVKDTCRLKAVRWLCADGLEKRAEPYLVGMEMRGHAVTLYVEHQLEPSARRREETVKTASYQVYLCQREMSRLQMLGHNATAAQVKYDLEEWKRLKDLFTGGTPT